jgi:hypothetical protein
VITLPAQADRMIAMTATLRPAAAPDAVALLGQNLRRHFEHVLLHTQQMLVMVDSVGPVLVTTEPSRMRFDIVADSQRQMDARMRALEAAVADRLPALPLHFAWERAAAIPVPFR